MAPMSIAVGPMCVLVSNSERSSRRAALPYTVVDGVVGGHGGGHKESMSSSRAGAQRLLRNGTDFPNASRALSLALTMTPTRRRSSREDTAVPNCEYLRPDSSAMAACNTAALHFGEVHEPEADAGLSHTRSAAAP